MNQGNVLRIGLAVVALLLLVWLSQALEWVESETQEPAQGEAATNPWYASQRLITLLGGRVVKSDSLRDLPPPHATLLLQSAHWNLFPNTSERLRTWVEHGGHLVIPAHFVEQKQFQPWIPIERIEKPEATTAPSPPASPAGAAPTRLNPKCHEVTARHAADDSAGPASRLQLCGYAGYTLETQHPMKWSIQGPDGYEGMRIAVGQGSVTVLEPFGLGTQQTLLEADNAQILVAALNLRSHSEVWFVLDEKRPPLRVWIWSNGWPAVLLCLGALAVAVWRGMVRFGPTTTPPETARRSMAEQVRGTAQFLRRDGAFNLHQAQLRALDEMATRHIRNYRSLGLDERAQRIAHATHLAPTALTHAMRHDVPRSPHALYLALQLLESARRRLRQADAVTPLTP